MVGKFNVAASNALAIVTWTKPAGSGTNPFTGNRVVAGQGQICNTKKPTCILSLGKPTAGKCYTFAVTAQNKSGASKPTSAKARATGLDPYRHGSIGEMSALMGRTCSPGISPDDADQPRKVSISH